MQYDSLASVYEFLVPEPLLGPAGSHDAFGQWVEDLPPGAEVLDCACGPGQLAVALAQAGLTVTATDASPEMTTRAAALAADHHVQVATATLTWEDLGGRNWGGRFATVFCVGNSLTHAAGADGRQRALRNMAEVLQPGGCLVLTSRNWELLRASRPELEVGDQLVVRRGRRALVIHNWSISVRWEEQHELAIAVALLGADEVVTTIRERLVFWPFRHGQLIQELADSGLDVVHDGYSESAERYLLAARKRASTT
jgi:2-polyprenyl-3-methyl-5-hydroxy-6-metoxy-1,4-benzoquinol methylase